MRTGSSPSAPSIRASRRMPAPRRARPRAKSASGCSRSIRRISCSRPTPTGTATEALGRIYEAAERFGTARDDPHRNLRLSRSAQPLRGSDGRRRCRHRLSEAAHHPRARGTSALHADGRLPRSAPSQRPPRPLRDSAEEAARVPSPPGGALGQVPLGDGLPQPGHPSMRKNADDFLALPISEEAKRKILWDNAAKLIA